jgi:DNA replication protein DnaC
MPEPQRIGGEAVMRRMQAILEARGLNQIEPGPIDQTPTPDEPGHPDYHHRQRVEIAVKRWKNAVPYRYQDATATHPDIVTWADNAARDWRAAGFLVLTGSFGTGKTHQAYGALRRIAEAGPDRFEMIAMTAPDMYGLLRPGGSDRGTEAELKRLCSIPLLLLDDLGTEKISEWTEEATYRLLNERYNECRPLIVTSNFPTRSDKGEDLSDRLGGRIASRLAQLTTVVVLGGPDLRRVVA